MKTILVLEDERAVMGLFRLVLDGYTILEATTAEEALQKFLEHSRHVDLLIADVILPVGSGIHTALLLREARSELGIVLTSGYPRTMWNDQDAADLGRLGLGSHSVAILQKPFSPATLMKTVHSFLGPPLSRTTVAASSNDSSSLRQKDEAFTEVNRVPTLTYPKAVANVRVSTAKAMSEVDSSCSARRMDSDDAKHVAAIHADHARQRFECLDGEIDASIVFAVSATTEYQTGNRERAEACHADAKDGHATVISVLSKTDLTSEQREHLDSKLSYLQQLLDRLPAVSQANEEQPDNMPEFPHPSHDPGQAHHGSRDYG